MIHNPTLSHWLCYLSYIMAVTFLSLIDVNFASFFVCHEICFQKYFVSALVVRL